MNNYTLTVVGHKIPLSASYVTVLDSTTHRNTTIDTTVTNNDRINTQVFVNDYKSFWIQYEDGREQQLVSSREFTDARSGQGLSLVFDADTKRIVSIVNHSTRKSLLYMHRIAGYYGLAQYPKDVSGTIFFILLLIGIATAFIAGYAEKTKWDWIYWPTIIIGIISFLTIAFVMVKKNTAKKMHAEKMDAILSDQLLNVAQSEVNKYG
jgi:hypothetical protein